MFRNGLRLRKRGTIVCQAKEGFCAYKQSRIEKKMLSKEA